MMPFVADQCLADYPWSIKTDPLWLLMWSAQVRISKIHSWSHACPLEPPCCWPAFHRLALERSTVAYKIGFPSTLARKFSAPHNRGISCD